MSELARGLSLSSLNVTTTQNLDCLDQSFQEATCCNLSRWKTDWKTTQSILYILCNFELLGFQLDNPPTCSSNNSTGKQRVKRDMRLWSQRNRWREVIHACIGGKKGSYSVWQPTDTKTLGGKGGVMGLGRGLGDGGGWAGGGVGSLGGGVGSLGGGGVGSWGGGGVGGGGGSGGGVCLTGGGFLGAVGDLGGGRTFLCGAGDSGGRTIWGKEWKRKQQGDKSKQTHRNRVENEERKMAIETRPHPNLAV